MQLYTGTSKQFIEDAVQNQISEKLRLSFLDHFRYSPSPQEVNSWRNSLSKIKDVFQRADLSDHGVILEYQLPLSSKRLDCLVTGKDGDKRDNAVIVELKQWDKCQEDSGENEVLTWVGQGERAVLHPSVQVGQYQTYLQDCHTAFYEDKPVFLHSCAYLHNYSFAPKDPLLVGKFKTAIKDFPLFSMDDVDKISGYLSSFLSAGDGMPVLSRIQNSKYRASKKLLEHVGAVIKSKKDYILLDEQLVVYDKVIAAAKAGFHDKKKTVVVIKGGPGTGKSVIALNLMADLSLKGYNAHYATGSRAFTETLRKITGTRAAAQFKYFNQYAMAEANEVDVLILDEAHRIRKSSVDRFTPKNKRSGLSQVEEIIKASKVSVFFVDDYQVVRPMEIGSASLIEEAAKTTKCKLEEFQLETQFRCAGSDGFMNWLDNTLGIRKTANILWQGDSNFDFRIVDSPEALEGMIRQKVAEGYSGRLAAGYCWPWSDPNADGQLENDVVVGKFERPWNAKPDAKRLAPGIPKALLWAYDPNGIDQVGCVYTAQGFEFDYVGVIVGPDLHYNPTKGAWEGNKDHSCDSVVRRSKERFVDMVKNTYRVLLSRGLRGCFVYFMEEDTKHFFLSRMEIKSSPEGVIPLSKLLQEVPAVERFTKYLPVYSLAAAAGRFSEEQRVVPLGWAPAKIGRPLSKDMFIARVQGRSMEPLIKDGSYSVFRWEKGGSRNGKVVLVEAQGVNDPESTGRYTVKRYHSEKQINPDGTWVHKKIVLSPENKEFQDIELNDVSAESFRVIAEWVASID